MLTNRELEEIGQRLRALPAWLWRRTYAPAVPRIHTYAGPPAEIQVLFARGHQTALEDFLTHAQADTAQLLETVAELMRERQELSHQLAEVQERAARLTRVQV